MKKPTAKTIFHVSRMFMFALLALALLAAQTDSGSALRLTYQKDVLAYASNMSIADLLSATNASRAENGLAPLTLDDTLNTSAQLKANDMVEKDYWSHVSPDGTQPWYWYDQAGYKYSAAGENLAFGFSNGQEVETAWMNSPAHRENVLGNYENVGFGIANSASFQGYENTVVVAHYGTKRAETTTAISLQEANPTAPVDETVATAESATITVLGLIRDGSTPTYAALGIGLVAIAAAGFGLVHRAYLRHALKESQRFVAHHPLIDATAICVTLGAILTSTAGYLL